VERMEKIACLAGVVAMAVYTIALTYMIPLDGKTELAVENLSVSPARVPPGGEVTVSVDVANLGREGGTRTVEIRLDGEPYGTRTVSLGPGQSTTVEFAVSSDEVGTHTVSVGGLTGSFEVA